MASPTVEYIPAVSSAPIRAAKPDARLVSLDAYRGFIMFLLASTGFGLSVLAKHPGWGWLAYQVDLEADRFWIRQEANGGVLIESAGPVRVTGFTLGQDINNLAVLRDAPGNVLTWQQGFKLRIPADGTLEWGCCPRKE